MSSVDTLSNTDETLSHIVDNQLSSYFVQLMAYRNNSPSSSGCLYLIFLEFVIQIFLQPKSVKNKNKWKRNDKQIEMKRNDNKIIFNFEIKTVNRRSQKTKARWSEFEWDLFNDRFVEQTDCLECVVHTKNATRESNESE